MSQNKVTVNTDKREVVLHLEGVEVALTFNRVRQLDANGLSDAIMQVYGIDTSPEADAELAAAGFEMEDRKRTAYDSLPDVRKLQRELEMHRADYDAIKAAGFQDPGELLDAYKKLAAQKPALYLPAKKKFAKHSMIESTTTNNANDANVVGWNSAIEEVSGLNDHLEVKEY